MSATSDCLGVGLGNAASGISQGTAERVFDLYDAVNTDAEKLAYLQTYSSTCWKALDQASKLKVSGG